MTLHFGTRIARTPALAPGASVGEFHEYFMLLFAPFADLRHSRLRFSGFEKAMTEGFISIFNPKTFARLNQCARHRHFVTRVLRTPVGLKWLPSCAIMNLLRKRAKSRESVTTQSHGSKPRTAHRKKFRCHQTGQDRQAAENSKTVKRRRHRVRYLKSACKFADHDRPTDRNAKPGKPGDAKSWV